MEWPRVDVCPSLLLRDHDSAADQRYPCADPTRALSLAEIDLPGGGASAAEAGGIGFNLDS